MRREMRQLGLLALLVVGLVVPVAVHIGPVRPRWLTAPDGDVSEPPPERLAAAIADAALRSSTLADLVAARGERREHRNGTASPGTGVGERQR